LRLNDLCSCNFFQMTKAVAATFLTAVFLPLTGISQSAPDSSLFSKEIQEIVITATRTERKLSNTAVPTTIISQKNIQQAGSLRLKDILQEQTGLFITNGFGAGVQMQGLNPDYTLILIDGEPLTGRTAGVLDINRLTVGNIKKIEVIKGPSSSLYGSEALAGVINVITDKSYAEKLNANLRYGTYNTLDAGLTAAKQFGKLGVNAFTNYYRTDGFSIRPSSVERAKLPITRITPQVQLRYAFNNKTNLSVSLRYNYEYIKNELATSNNGVITYTKGREINKDINITPVLTHQFNAALKSVLRLYGTVFEGSQQLNATGGQGYDDYLRHQFYRAENQTDYTIAKNLTVLAGAGFIKEMVNSTRYDDKSSRKENDIVYAFSQAEWEPLPWLTFIGGVRYDNNKLYASAFSPKAAVLVKVNSRLSFNGSFGKGFKSPDFRQLYLNFTNTAAGSYSVFGTIDAVRIIAEQQSQGLIQQLEPDFYKLAILKPEFSTGTNIGFTAYPAKNLQWKMNFFRNDVKDLIETRQVAIRTDNSQVFSYINVKRAYTKGIETNIVYQLSKALTLAAGYQLLYTADKDELEQLSSGVYYTTGSVLLKRKDYSGLPNRSAHMANLKLTYENKPGDWFANTRIIYRSPWAVFDRDGNGIYNKQDEFAGNSIIRITKDGKKVFDWKGMLLVNFAAGKNLGNGLSVQAGVDNATNYIDALNMPNQPGLTVYGTVSYQFCNNKKTKKERI
jgi:outer membrane receptor for ferrienterochelin and colicins